MHIAGLSHRNRSAHAAIGGAIVLAVLTALLLDTSPARAAFPGLNGTIACGGVRAPGTDTEIFQVNPDGTGETTLTSNDVRDGSPAYSPDGTKIAWESQRDNVPDPDGAGPLLGEPANTEIYVANNDGDLEGPDVRRLTFNKGVLANGTLSGLAATDFSPSWSPDGTEIVFHSGRTTTFSDGGTSPVNDFEIYKMSAITGESVTPATRLTVKRGQDAIPSWSPDGTKIAFQGFPAGNPSNLPVNLEVFTMNPDGTGLTNVSNNPGTPNDPATTVNENSNAVDRFAIWSPDSQQIAYSSTRGATVPGNLNDDVWRANRDGSNPVRLTTNPDSPDPEPFTDFDVPLVWSPDGREILFSTSRDSTISEDVFAAYRMSAVTGDTGPASVQRVARMSQFQRCDWQTVQPAAVTPPAPPPDAPSGPAPAAASKLTAKLSLARATINRRDRVLDVFAPITSLASGRVDVELHAAGRRFRFTAPIDSTNARIRFRQRIPAAQARLGTGILTITYSGDADTRSQTVRLRAAFRPAVLRLARPTIASDGRLRASGTVSPLARGVVRVQLEYVLDDKTVTRQFNARIANGRWSINQPLSQAVRDEIARRSGTVHSYTLFTGYLLARMRGEMRSFQVLGNR